MRHYVLGFAFDHIDGTSVLLINKNKPDWQAGKLNALGGHIETGESPDDAMVREFREECGLITTVDDWYKFCIMKGTDFVVHCYRTNVNIMLARSMTDEKIEIVSEYWLAKENRLISNIRWLIEMSKDVSKSSQCLEVLYD